jgi:diacylglycerol kinase (ATP)
MKRSSFSIRSRLQSFGYAWAGICSFFKTEHNAWIHAAATIVVAALAIILQVSRGELLALIIVIGAVWVTEILNTAIEKIMDFISPQIHPLVKRIKDLSAAAVLVAAITAAATGLIIFIPKIW